MARVLVIPDTHFPFEHPRGLDFLCDTYNIWRCDKVVHIGDVTDNHMCGKYAKHPDALGAKREVEEAQKAIDQYKGTFPEMLVCIGNHCDRPTRLAAEVFMDTKFLRPYADVWDTPGWDWAEDHEIDGVLYTHGINSTGKNAALNLALASLQSTVQGHTHTFPGVAWNASNREAIFGLNVGCLIDPKAYAMAYGKHFKHKPVLGCGVVIDGDEAHFIKMALGRKSRYGKRSKYGRRKR